MDEQRWQQYRQVIDGLVEDALHGQGQIRPRLARAGVWNANARPDYISEQWAINDLLARLAPADREVIAGMLLDAFTGGIHQSLVRLHEESVPPFDKAYEGTPFHDFVGRLAAWEWPEELVPSWE